MLYVDESGPVTAPAIVFLHGGGLSGRMWEPQIEGLPEYHCLVPDLPEQGRSIATGPFILDGAAQDVATIIRERVPSGRAHIVGLSLGGAVGLTVLRLFPEVVDHLIVSGTAAGLGKVLGAISIAGAALYRFIPAETLVRLAYTQFHIPPAYYGLVHDDLVLGMNATFTRHYTQALMTMELPRGTAAPTLIAVGERETIPAKRAARRLGTTVGNAQQVIVPGVGHLWNLEAPALFTAMVRAWIRDKPLPEGLRVVR
ncbi:MAG: alpha/beta hydrolase [Herpetosiphonaceae bacterium]|nr:alpha/beta hydrolase [Herpetosiphonaceae bacterium]